MWKHFCLPQAVGWWFYLLNSFPFIHNMVDGLLPKKLSSPVELICCSPCNSSSILSWGFMVFTLSLHICLWMNHGSLRNLYVVFRSLTPLFGCCRAVAASPFRESTDPVDIFWALDLVYFLISKKSLMIVAFLLRNLFLICILVWLFDLFGQIMYPQ